MCPKEEYQSINQYHSSIYIYIYIKVEISCEAFYEENWNTLKVIISACVKSSKIEKCIHFTHFDQKKKKKLTSVGIKLCIDAQLLY